MSANPARKHEQQARARAKFRSRRRSPGRVLTLATPDPVTGEVEVVPGIVWSTPGLLPMVLATLERTRPDLMARVPQPVINLAAVQIADAPAGPRCWCCGRRQGCGRPRE